MAGDWQDYIILVAAIIILVWTLARRKKAGLSLKVDAVRQLLAEINENLKILEKRIKDPRSKKTLKTKVWVNFQGRTAFLGEENVKGLIKVYNLAFDCNRQIDRAKKNRDPVNFQNIQIDYLKDLMVQSKEKLDQWIRTNPEEQQPGKNNRNFPGL
jgi:hypothetical protein